MHISTLTIKRLHRHLNVVEIRHLLIGCGLKPTHPNSFICEDMSAISLEIKTELTILTIHTNMHVCYLEMSNLVIRCLWM